MPDELAKTVQAIKEAGWWRLGLAEEIGGMPAPPPLAWAVNEMIYCANPSACFFNLGPVLAQSLYIEGNDEQRRWAAEGVQRGWQATMVLTEPDAGSDVGAGRTKAFEQPDGTWHIEGVKRFISGGDVGNTAENIFHLVLARPEGAGPGTKGLSLFYVPNYLFDPDTFELGARNGVYVTGLEHKMGLKSSPTCELTFGGADVPAVGYLVGGVHNGIAQMFTVIEHARMTIGVKSAGTLSTGYLNALAFAKERVQGADLTQMTDKTAPRVTIMHHPDVRRSLMTQKGLCRRPAGAVPVCRCSPGRRCGPTGFGCRSRHGAPRGRSAAAHRQGRGFRTRLRNPHRVAADAGRLGLSGRLSPRAVHP